MAGYNLQLTNGNLLVVVPDGTSDSATTSLSLVGRNFPGYGVFLNQNFIKLTENFSNGSAPNNPLQGQLWWDNANKLLKVYDGTGFKVVGSGATGEGNAPPVNPAEGDIWWDPLNKQLYVWNSSGAGAWSLIGPATSAAGAATAFLANVNGIQTLGNISVMGKTVATFSNGDYAPFSPTVPVPGITTVRPGLNFASTVESSMISSPNLVFGVSSSNIQITSLTANQGFQVKLRPGNTETICLNINGVNGRVTVAADPQENLGVATKQYVDTIATNLTTTINNAVANVELPTDGGGNTVFESTIVPSANLLYNLGSNTLRFNNVYGGNGFFHVMTAPTVNSTTVAATTMNGTTVNSTTMNGTTMNGTTVNATNLNTTNVVVASKFEPIGNLSVDLGSTSKWFNNIYGTAIHAKYADLAERFHADAMYDAGTVVELGGEAEITSAITELSEEVFGVISTQAAYLMNSAAGSDLSHPPVAVQGRVPVKVVGKVVRGDRLVSAGNGYARAGARHELSAWNVIGRALENKHDDGPGMVEAVVKLNS